MKTSPSIFSPTIKAVILTLSISWFAWGLTDVFWSLYINEIVGDNYFLAGLSVGIFQFITIISVLICGDIVDAIGSLRMLFYNRLIYFFVGPLYFLAGMLHSPWILLFGFLVNGVGKGLRDVGEQAFLMKHSNPQNCSRILGIDAAVKNIFWIMGIFIGAVAFYFIGAQFSEITLVATLYLLLSPAAGVGITLLYKQKNYFEKCSINISEKLKKTIVEDKIILPLLRDFKQFSLPLQFSIFLVGFLDFLVQTVAFFIPLRALEMGLSYFQIALLVGGVFLPNLFLFYSAKMGDKCDRLLVMQRIFFLFIIPLIGLSLTDNYWIMGICSILIILFHALVSPALLGFITAIAPEKKKGEIASLEFFSMRMASLIGVFIFGFISEKWSIQTAFFCVAACVIALSIVMLGLPAYLQKKKIEHRKMLHKKHKLRHHHMVFSHTHFHYSHRRH